MRRITPTVQAALISTVQTAAAIATRTREWVVVVVPDGSDFLSAFQQYAAGAFPQGTFLGGRTALLPSGVRISIAFVGQDPFVPKGVPYSVIFAGWGDDVNADNRRMSSWRTGATKVYR